LNVLYDTWVKASPEEKEQAHNRLGEDLYYYIRRIIRREFPEWKLNLEDGIGEASHNIFKGIATFDATKGSFKQWVYGITVNACIDLLRTRQRRREVEYFGVEDVVEHTDREAKLALDKLRENLTEAENDFIDAKLHGMSNEELAVELGLSEQTIKNKWGLLLEKLRTRGGGDVEDSSEINDHGPKWQACMHRITKEGAMEDLW